MEPIFDLVVRTADGVFGVDQQQRIVFWNRAAGRILGLSAEQTLGRHCYEVFGGRNGQLGHICRRDCPTMSRARQSQTVPARELRVHPAHDRELWLSCSTLLVPSRWQHLSILIHIFRDITRQKEVEQGLLSLYDRLARLVTALGQDAAPGSEDLPGLSGLTEREHEVLRLLATGASTDAVAESLCISSATVRNHVRHILTKLGVHTRLEAVALGLQNGLIPGRRLLGRSGNSGSRDSTENP